MKINTLTSLVLLLIIGICGVASAEEDIISTVETGCAAETENYCSQVTLGEGRLLACYYAHEDKLSSECVTALYNAIEMLQAEVNALTHVASECNDDINKFCTHTEPGDGRVAKCLGYHSEELSKHCSTAINRYLE